VVSDHDPRRLALQALLKRFRTVPSRAMSPRLRDPAMRDLQAPNSLSVTPPAVARRSEITLIPNINLSIQIP